MLFVVLVFLIVIIVVRVSVSVVVRIVNRFIVGIIPAVILVALVSTLVVIGFGWIRSIFFLRGRGGFPGGRGCECERVVIPVEKKMEVELLVCKDRQRELQVV